MAKIYTFSEHDVTVSGEAHHLIDLAVLLHMVDTDNIWSDLAYKIELAFNDEFRREVES